MARLTPDPQEPGDGDPRPQTVLGAAPDEPITGCALTNLQAAEDPVGSATPFDALVLLEIAPPWPAVALQDPRVPAEFRDGLAELAQQGVRTTALLVDAGATAPDDGAVGITVWCGEAPTFTPYTGVHARRRPEHLLAFVRSVIDGTDPGPDVHTARPTWLMCTHGARDACCGRFGEAALHAAQGLRDQAQRTPHAASFPQVWRCSHLSGHRFAPTLLALPEGRMWGFLDEAALRALADPAGPPPPLRRHYRGWCALPPYAQAAERDLYAAHGAAWRSAEVAVEPLGSIVANGVPAAIEVRAEGLGTAGTQRWRADLVVTHGAAVPASCGGPAAPRRHVRPRWHDDPVAP